MTSRNIKLVLSYDGTDFGGWQRQVNARSVQEELEKALAKMHGHPVPTVGAGRTDAGVHAMGQAANFYTDIASIPARKFVLALNRLLPPDLRVLESSEADRDFHARYDARLRRYRYFTLCGSVADPVRLRYAHHLRRIPDIESLNTMASLLIGENDFTTFSAARDPSANRSRYVHEAAFRWEDGFLVFQIAANAFLWRMVRSLVGSMFWLEAIAKNTVAKSADAKEAAASAPSGRQTSDAARTLMAEALGSRDRSRAGPTAPAHGLFLWNVEYYANPTRPGRGSHRANRGQ